MLVAEFSDVSIVGEKSEARGQVPFSICHLISHVDENSRLVVTFCFLLVHVKSNVDEKLSSW